LLCYKLKLSMKQNIILIFILAGLLITGCGGSQKIKGIHERSYDAPKLPARVDINSRAYNFYINATIYELMGETAIANRQYGEALKYYPESDFIRQAYATSLFDLGRYGEAKDEILKIKNRDLETWVVLANCLNYLGHSDSLANAYLNIIALDSFNVEAYYRLGIYYQGTSNFDSAIISFERLAELSPSFRIYNRIGDVQIQAGYIDAAEKSLLNSIALDSTAHNIPSFVNLSIIYENNNKQEEAEKYLLKAVSLSPDDPKLQDRMFEYYRRYNKIDDALSVALQQAEIEPDNLPIKRRMALMYFDVDSLALADSVFQVLIDAGDSSAVNLYYSGRIALFNEDYGRGKALFESLTQSVDSLIDGWLNLGLYYRFTDSTNQEIEIYERGLEHVTNIEDSIALCFSAGVSLERNGQFDRSISYFERVIKMDPANSQALNYLGYMLADNGVRLEEAKSLIERALELSPNNGAYLDSYGWVLYKLGDIKKAKETLLLAHKFVDNDPVILEHIGDIYEALGNMEKANEFWQKSLNVNPDNKEVKGKLTE